MKVLFSITALVIAILWVVAIQMAPVESEEGITVIYWSTDQNPARSQQLAPFAEMHPEIEVRIEPTTFEKTIIQWYSGIGPDIIEIYSQNDMVSYAKAGVLMDLTEKAAEMGFTPQSSYSNLSGMMEYDGRQYTYPANLACQNIFYNKKMFRDAGVEYPTDRMAWEDFIELVKPLTLEREDGRGYKQFAMVMGRHYASDIHLQFGARFFNEKMTECVLDSPKSLEAIQFYYDLMQKYKVIPTPDAAAALSSEGGWGAGEIRWFATKRAASIWGSRWMLVQFRQYPEVHKEIGCVLLPSPNGGNPASFTAGRTPGINVNSKKKEAALKFMAYLASPEYSEMIAVGADAMPPSKEYATDPSRLLNPDFPSENFQEKFVEAMEYAGTPEISPFIDPKFANRIWLETLEIVENDLKPIDQAMADATKQINDRIQKNIRSQKKLRKLYDELTSKNVTMAALN